MTGIRDDELLRQGVASILRRIDPFDTGILAEELFPELIEKARMIGVELREYKEKDAKFGYIKFVDIVNLDSLSSEEVLSHESPSERHWRLHFEDVQK